MEVKVDMMNINIVVEGGACIGCCECLSSCAENNIYMLYSQEAGHPIPFVAAEGCTGCGECLKECKQFAKDLIKSACC